MAKQFHCVFCGSKADFLKQNGSPVVLCGHCNREIDILEKREFYRVETDIPCACSKPWADGNVEKISMKIVDLSPGGRPRRDSLAVGDGRHAPHGSGRACECDRRAFEWNAGPTRRRPIRSTTRTGRASTTAEGGSEPAGLPW